MAASAHSDRLHPFGGSPLLEIVDLDVAAIGDGSTRAVPILRRLQLIVPERRRVGIVGESGSGKSMTVAAVLRVFPRGVTATSGSIVFAGRDLHTLDESEMRRVRGKEISVVFQNAMSSLHPMLTVGEQVSVVCRAHLPVSKSEARTRSVEMLDALGIPNASQRADDYPHQFSGGMAQRVAIAMALICDPSLLIADEPTTGLDATIQAQVLEVIGELTSERGAALLLISHDLGVIESTCEIVAVVYAGELMELGFSRDVLGTPLSPYTQGSCSAWHPQTASPRSSRAVFPSPGRSGRSVPSRHGASG